MPLEQPTSEKWYVTVEFSLDGSVTKRYAEDELILSDATLWEGWLKGFTTLTRSLGSILDPRIHAPHMTLTFDNQNKQMQNVLDTYNFANRVVTIRAGYGTTVANYSTIFVGIVHFPGGESWTEKTATIEIDALLSGDDQVLPKNKINLTDYPNAEAKSLFTPIPLLYGDWYAAAGGGEKVPAYQIDSTEGTGGRFKTADHAIKSIETVYLNDVSKSFTAATADLDKGEFVLDVTYATATDTCTVNCRGATDTALSGGTMLQTLPDICEDILSVHLAVVAGDRDSAAFTTWEGNLTVNDYGRRWIGPEIRASQLITESLIEGFADMTIIAGKYKPVYREVGIAAGIPSYYDYDIELSSSGERLFGVTKDPERVFCNQVAAPYRYDPIAADFAQRYDKEDTGSINTYNTRRRRRLEMHYLYITVGAESRAQRELYAFSTEIEMVELTLRSVAVDKQPTDQFKLVYDKYDLGSGIGTAMQIRKATANFKQFGAPVLQVLAWNMNALAPGRWTSDTHPTWLLSSAAERTSGGYWTDANGYADPGGTPDEASKFSIWF